MQKAARKHELCPDESAAQAQWASRAHSNLMAAEIRVEWSNMRSLSVDQRNSLITNNLASKWDSITMSSWNQSLYRQSWSIYDHALIMEKFCLLLGARRSSRVWVWCGYLSGCIRDVLWASAGLSRIHQLNRSRKMQRYRFVLRCLRRRKLEISGSVWVVCRRLISLWLQFACKLSSLGASLFDWRITSMTTKTSVCSNEWFD